MGFALQVTKDLVSETCCNCGTTFAMDAAIANSRRKDRDSFYCPNGHGQHYTGKTEAEKTAELLREQLARTQSSLATERELRLSTERTLARTKKRIANGVCPCCKRSFSNLRAHMAHQHPDMAKKVPTQI